MGRPHSSRRQCLPADDNGARIGYLDGLIMGGPEGIGGPDATLLFSGPENLYRAHRPALAALGGNLAHVGADPGRAAGFDATMLDVFWTSMIGVVHAFRLAAAEYPGEASSLESAAASMDHVLRTIRADNLDNGVLTAARAAVRQAIEAGHGSEAFTRLAAPARL